MTALPRRMTASPGGLLARAAAFVLAPAEDGEHPPGSGRAQPVGEPPRPIVAVVGLVARAGASTIARALAGRLAAEDPEGAALLSTPAVMRSRVTTPAAARLVRRVAELGYEGARAAGRLCLVPATEPLAPIAARLPAPLVADLGHGEPADGAVALADHVVLVCPPDVEPALPAAVERSLRAADRAVSVVANRALGGAPPELPHAVAVPDSRLAAQLTLACRGPSGGFAEPIAELAERSLAEARR